MVLLHAMLVVYCVSFVMVLLLCEMLCLFSYSCVGYIVLIGSLVLYA